MDRAGFEPYRPPLFLGWLATSRVQGGRSPADLPALFSLDLDDSSRIFLDFILDGLLLSRVSYL